MTEQQLRTIIAQTAMGQLGYVGDHGTSAQPPKRTNKFAEYLDTLSGFYSGKKNGYHWCAMFVDWVQLNVMGREIMEIITNHHKYGCDCDHAFSRYQLANKIVGRPEVGDEVFYYKDSTGNFTHTGIVVSVSNDQFGAIEGNCSNSVKLYYKNFKSSDGYTHFFASPDYKLAAEMLSAKELNEFEKWAVDNGLLVGDGKGNYYMEENLTRSQMCTMLYRFHEKFIK